MKLHYINENEIIDECNKRGIKRIGAAVRWLKRNSDKTFDDYIEYIKSKPNSNNYKICKEKDLSYNTVRQWINRKDGRTVDDFINRPPFLTQLCKENNVNYKNAEKWLNNHKDRSFNDYVKYLNEKAAKKVSRYKRSVSNESVWLRNHPNATNEEYINYLIKIGKLEKK